MKFVLIGGLIVVMVAYGILSRRPDVLRRASPRALRERFEPQRVAVARRPLLWFVVIGTVSSTIVGVFGAVADIDLYPLGMVALAAFGVAWACDERSRDRPRPRRRLALGLGFALLYLAPDLWELALYLPEWRSPAFNELLETLLRTGLVPAVTIGWVLSGDVSPTMAIRRLVRRLWTPGPRWSYAFALLAWPLATAAIMAVWALTGIADLESTRVSPMEFLMRDASGMMADGTYVFGGRLLGIGIWSMSSLQGALWQLLALVSSVLETAPLVVAWYAFVAPRLMWRLSPLLTAVSICAIASVTRIWVLLPVGGGGFLLGGTTGRPELAGILLAAVALAVPLSIAVPATAVWLMGKRRDGLLPVVLMVGASSMLAQLVAYSWIDPDRYWAGPLAVALSQLGVGVVLVVACRMWRMPGPEPAEGSLLLEPAVSD